MAKTDHASELMIIIFSICKNIRLWLKIYKQLTYRNMQKIHFFPPIHWKATIRIFQ